MKKLGIVILKWINNLWTIRNEELHGRDETEKQEKLQEKMTRDLNKLCGFEQKVKARD